MHHSQSTVETSVCLHSTLDVCVCFEVAAHIALFIDTEVTAKQPQQAHQLVPSHNQHLMRPPLCYHRSAATVRLARSYGYLYHMYCVFACLSRGSCHDLWLMRGLVQLSLLTHDA